MEKIRALGEFVKALMGRVGAREIWVPLFRFRFGYIWQKKERDHGGDHRTRR